MAFSDFVLYMLNKEKEVRAKLIKITRCKDCPKLIEGRINDYCNSISRAITKEDCCIDTELPEWCPLEDYKC